MKISMPRNSSNVPGVFVSADTETTGFSPANGDRIVEIALLRFVEGEVADKFVSLIHPQRPIPPLVTEMCHGITNAMVAESPTFTELFPKIVDFIGEDPLVFHNAPFDLPFLEMESRLAGEEWPSRYRVYDTLDISRKSRLFGRSHRLPDLAMEIGLSQRFHRAEADAYAVGKLLLHLAEKGARIVPHRFRTGRFAPSMRTRGPGNIDP